ncbi:MAG: dipeptide ABC transporter ATP-binding protein [Trebonia sp.]
MTSPADSVPAAPATDPAAPALDVSNLDVAYRVRGTDRLALRDVSFVIGQGETYGLVGESGSGKSTAALALVRYLPRNGRVSGGTIRINGRDPLAMGRRELRELRARTVSMVYQEPSRALNPALRVGRQIAEAFIASGTGSSDTESAADATAEMLSRVRIPDPRRVMERYPHELSGGMAQRVVIAMALASQPELLILDEPTTALDATVQAEVLDLLAPLRDEFRTSVLFISHNLAVISQMCDRVGVLYAGELVEQGRAQDVFALPRHPYTVGLLRSVPKPGQRKDGDRLNAIPGFLPAPGDTPAGCMFAPRCALAAEECRTPPPWFATGPGRTSRCYRHADAPDLPRSVVDDPRAAEVRPGTAQAGEELLTVTGVSKTYGTLRALRDVSLNLRRGETLGLVGESGSGKTTLARVLLGLTPPDPGASVNLDGTPLAATLGRRSRGSLRDLQIVFQDPDSALNRRHTVRSLIARPLVRLAGLSGSALAARLAELAGAVRLEERHLPMRPGQLSGGLKQRVAIARAFGGGPKVVVCDEPTSALDVSVQAAILNLLADLQAEQRVSYVFISHDLELVRYLADQIVVLYAGRVLESGQAADVFSSPHHPYTEALLSAVPSVGGPATDRIRLDGEPPTVSGEPVGCPFHTRCPRKLPGGICESTEPDLLDDGQGHLIRCRIPVGDLRVLQRGEAGSAQGEPQ